MEIDGNRIVEFISALTDDDLERIVRRCKDDLERLLLTQEQAAKLLGVSAQAISYPVKRGTLVPALVIGKRRLFLLSDVEARRGLR